MSGPIVVTVTDQWGTQSTYPFRGEAMSFGRAEDNDVIVKTNFVSRHHARIYRQAEEVFLLVDVGSSNGTYVGGKRIKEYRLRSDEVFTLGNFRIQVSFDVRGREASSIFHATDGQPMEIQKVAVEEAPLLQSLQAAGAAASAAVELPPAPPRSGSGPDPFLILYRIGERLNQCSGLDDLFRLIIELVMEIAPAERAFLLLTNEQGELVPRAKKITPVRGTTGVDTISRTIAYTVLREGKAILSRETDIDPNMASESIMNMGIISVLCVPLWDGTRVMGVLYLDAKSRAQRFTKENLDLLLAVGFQISQAVSRAQLNERMKYEESIRANLERFHSPEIVDHIIRESLQQGALTLAPTEQEVTILFTDIKGFTAIAERLSAVEISRFLNGYFSAITDIVFEHGGTLDKFIGDAVMAVFGTPRPKFDDAIRAARSALAVRDNIPRISVEGHPELRIETRIGLNTGRVVCGNIGSERRMEYTVLGDAVNVANRLEAACEPGRILIGEATQRLVDPYFFTEFAGERQVKGKALPLRTWWLDREKT